MVPNNESLLIKFLSSTSRTVMELNFTLDFILTMKNISMSLNWRRKEIFKQFYNSANYAVIFWEKKRINLSSDHVNWLQIFD